MPLPSSPHQPRFTAEQLAHARKVANGQRYPLQHVLRARLTLLLAEHPAISHAEAGRRCGMAPDTVYKWPAVGRAGLAPRRCAPSRPEADFFPSAGHASQSAGV